MRERKVCGFWLLWKNWEVIKAWSVRNSLVYLHGFGRTGMCQLLVAHSDATGDSHGLNHTSERYWHCLFTGARECPQHKNWIQWAEELGGHFLSHWGFYKVKIRWCFMVWCRRSQGQTLWGQSFSPIQGFSPISSFVYLLIWQIYMAYVVKARYCCLFWDHRNQQNWKSSPYSKGGLRQNPWHE